MKAYVRADPLENPEVLTDLEQRLGKQGIQLRLTTQRWQDILETQPFLYYRNAYFRFNNELEILKLIYQNDFKYIKNETDDVFGVNPRSASNNYFMIKNPVTFYRPKIAPLPILVGTHRRPEYLQLTLNGLKYTTQDTPDQKFYIVASNPDEATKEIIKKFLDNNSSAEAVISEENLNLLLFNFASKFFGLDKFVHFEDDGLLPESTSYQLPYWTQQLNHRSQTADLVFFRVSEQNQVTWLHKQAQLRILNYTYPKIDESQIWNYFQTKASDLPPISGNGIVIDVERDYRPVTFYTTDLNLYHKAKYACAVNIPIYHIGANQLMDYSTPSVRPTFVCRSYVGKNWRTGETKTINFG